MHMMQSEYVCVNIEHHKQCVCVCACHHVFMCTAALLVWCVEHCKPISQSRIWYTKTPSKHFLEFIQWNGLGAWKLSSLAVKQEELVYQERLTCDSFIVQSIPGWLDYREHERRAGETEQTQRRENIRGWREMWESVAEDVCFCLFSFLFSREIQIIISYRYFINTEHLHLCNLFINTQSFTIIYKHNSKKYSDAVKNVTHISFTADQRKHIKCLNRENVLF